MKQLIIFMLLVAAIHALDKNIDCHCEASRISRRITKRIVGGHPSKDPNVYPWLVKLQLSIDVTNKTVCGATVLNEDTLLTAAHCAPYPFINDTIRLMRVGVRGVDESIRVKEIIKYPKFLRPAFFTTYNDLAIFKLETPLNFTDSVQPACLDLSKQDRYTDLKVAGYGSITPIVMTNDLQIRGNTPSGILKEGEIFDQTKELCADQKEKVICVDSRTTNACIGDTGGGLMALRNGRTYVVGVLAMPMVRLNEDAGEVEICTNGNYVSRLSYYRHFIEQQIGDNYCAV